MKLTRLLLVGAGALALWGCSSGGSSTGGSGDPLTNGRAALNAMASGQQPTSADTLQSALTLFQQATQQNPASSEAYFGEAVCLAGKIGVEIDGGTGTATTPVTVPPATGGTGGGSTPNSRAALPAAAPTRAAGMALPAPPGGSPNIPAPPTSGAVPPAPPGLTTPIGPLPPTHVLGLFWHLEQGLSNPYTLLQMLGPIADLRFGLAPFMGYVQDNGNVARREQMLTDLGAVDQDLQKVEADPNFTTTIPDPDWNGQTVTIGLPEVYLFNAYVNSLRVQLALSLAYIRDPGTYAPVPEPVVAGNTANEPPPPPILSSSAGGSVSGSATAVFVSPYLALDTDHDGKLEPNEYLPPSPFLTLRDAAFLTTAQQAMQAVVDRETRGIAGVLARPTGGSFLIPNTTEVQTVLNNIQKNVLPLIQQAATGPVTLSIPLYQPVALVANGTVTGTQGSAGSVFNLDPPASPAAPQQVTIDVAAWFTRPPQDLKVFAPTYVLDANGFIDFSKTTYPDPTFGGLFPNGVPQFLQF